MSELDRVSLMAIKKFGLKAQLWKALEECGELITVIAKLENNQATHEQVIDEIADVTIMINQLAIIYNKGMVKERIEFKLERLKKKIKLASS